ncbi:NAD(P)-dependent malic enzyme [Halalkalibacterium halodurans]|uniref:Malate oxidoreductase (NAD) (Malic enzyme) n=1 Tax=Halalkalibacterium halodurans (strain ATCC BAA-125 / DSM 18197 / FERM 7344 / JCM 9153 / C-125) TaxID=272558 RepID=Q9KFS8_HALH5|nr:NADP-dependent malic enzyme [Halalkalibacterium halodurans]MDY7220892.1 NADP-dependent malic enzyme [Halalkalibacterium halodurans]MDY7240131.1 NADP-dependent malic enzyme [Halalkalibacterium halodurans]MED4125851.1 NADP-dependent malic enzyme [Halalkalibacterium halodurans]MED4173583.1 NADP-dependent malic enzyme [Halalkalibacterium halodurans]BAB04118.1 malate oxidoreductase (NAD) (malic enzyme) [Halalkalibacterium halodurans C-125]
MANPNLKEEAIALHQKHSGKLEIVGKMEITDEKDLSLVYTPGVADVCKQIAEQPDKVNSLTSRGNMVAIVTDGTAVLGLGNIGPKAAMPVMEGKALLFKKFANIDGFPVCLNTQDTDEIVQIIKALSPTFAGINLEDIAAPRCFEIEERLKEELDIPVFHDDQHGTAIVVLAALTNALKVVNKLNQPIKMVINGAGAAGTAIANLLLHAGFKDITLVSLEGVVAKGEAWLNPMQAKMAEVTNLAGVKGTLKDAITDADVFIGVSGPGAMKKEHIQAMAKDPIVLALANPIPEIYPEEAIEAGAAVVGTGRSDYPNQVNNLLAFPGIFRGALDAGAKTITMEMKIAAAYAIADVLSDKEVNANMIIPDALDARVAQRVAEAVATTALQRERVAALSAN